MGRVGRAAKSFAPAEIIAFRASVLEYASPLKKRPLAWLLIFPSHRDELTIARSFNCGWRAANDISPAGTAEPIRINSTNGFGQIEPQPSRWDEFRWRAPNPQLKLRAIVKSAAGARHPQRFFLHQPPSGDTRSGAFGRTTRTQTNDPLRPFKSGGGPPRSKTLRAHKKRLPFDNRTKYMI
jgi:hypothetical protein